VETIVLEIDWTAVNWQGFKAVLFFGRFAVSISNASTLSFGRRIASHRGESASSALIKELFNYRFK
jgi:hypothetical protein